MSDLELVLRTLNLLTAGLVAGATLFFQVSLVPIMRSWPEPMSLRLHKDFVVTADPDRYIKPAGAISLIAALLALVLGNGSPAGSVVMTILGIALFAGVAIISEVINVPVNRWAGAWGGGDVPPEYPRLRGRWERAHLWRTALAVLGLACYLVGALAAA